MPPDFNPNFQSPHWAWWIVLYFFVGGLTGGVYFAAAWLDLFGDEGDRPVVHLGHLLAFPMIIVSALFLIVDLGQPQRFLNMIFQSERLPLPILKPYSPMSLGSGILFIFGLVAFLSFVDALLHERFLHGIGNPLGKIASVIGAVGGLALAVTPVLCSMRPTSRCGATVRGSAHCSCSPESPPASRCCCWLDDAFRAPPPKSFLKRTRTW